MDLQTRKIEFIQAFLKLQSEEAISRFEKILKTERKSLEDHAYSPITEAELDSRIDQSERDFRNNRFKNSSDLLTKYE